MTWIEPLSNTPGSAVRVARRMREADRLEIFATRNDDDPDALAAEALASGPVSWAAGVDDEPHAVFGCAPMWPGVWSMWLFADDKFGHVGFKVTKLIIRHIVPQLFAHGAHRLECRSMEGHTDAQAWLSTIGASREGTLKGYGRGGEDFHVYTWARV